MNSKSRGPGRGPGRGLGRGTWGRDKEAGNAVGKVGKSWGSPFPSLFWVPPFLDVPQLFPRTSPDFDSKEKLSPVRHMTLIDV